MRHAFAVAAILLLLFPIYWMFSGSLMDVAGVLATPPRMFPHEPSLRNYQLVLSDLPLGLWTLNTLGMTATMVAVSTVTSAMAGYAFATQRGVGWLYWLFLTSIMVPRQTLIIPTFVLMRVLGLSGTRLAAILPAFFFPVGIFLFRNYVEAMPKGLMDSARMDGAGERQILVHIIAPLALPVVATLAVLKFIEGLTDYLWQMLVLQDIARQTVVVGLLVRIMQYGAGSAMTVNPIGMRMAAGVVLFLPLVAIFAVFRRSFLDGLMNGGLKD